LGIGDLAELRTRVVSPCDPYVPSRSRLVGTAWLNRLDGHLGELTTLGEVMTLEREVKTLGVITLGKIGDWAECLGRVEDISES